MHDLPGGSLKPAGAAGPDRMNLVVVVIDTLRYDVVHHTYSGMDVDVTNLDALRRESVDFSAAFGEGEPTIPVRRALWTGIRSFPWRYSPDTRGLWPTGRGWHRIPPHQPTLAELLLEAGYRTALISDVYHMFKPTMDFSRGWLSWEFVRGQESDNWKSGSLSLVAEEAKRYVKGEVDPDRDAMLLQYLLNRRYFERADGLTSGTVVRNGMQWLDDNHDAGPFALWLEAFDPHEPWDPPRSYADRYCPDFDGTEFIFPTPAASGTAQEQDRARALYFGEVTYVDERVGALVNKLADLGRLDDTIVMVISDHGTELMDHGRFGKSAPALHAHNTQMNWLVRHPALTGGGTVDEHVGSQDVFPTILDMLGIDGPERTGHDERYAGGSLWPLIRWRGGDVKADNPAVQRAREGRDVAITGWADHASVRSGTWNYIVNFECSDDRPSLFDLRTDPTEQTSVITDNPTSAAGHRAILERFLDQALPATLPDAVTPSRQPCQIYYRSQSKRPLQERAIDASQLAMREGN